MMPAPALLIIDDDPDARMMLAAFASQQGYESILAADGEEALASIAERAPDLVLMDAVMPGLDGFATCRKLKQHANGANVPVIFMTGLSDTAHVVEGLNAGGVDYVTKPLMLAELAARIRVHLANARTARTALSGLASVGAKLVTCDASGSIGWSTPQAAELIKGLEPQHAAELLSLLAARAGTGSADPAGLTTNRGRLSAIPLGDAGGGNHLFRLDRSFEGLETELLREAFGLTPREAEVLLWTSRGKSNKDMSEILNISARTVNKHLEQIFIKVGLENRASAASAATAVLLKA